MTTGIPGSPVCHKGAIAAFDPESPPFCTVCGDEILTPPNFIGGDRNRVECDKCFMNRIDPKVSTAWWDSDDEWEIESREDA